MNEEQARLLHRMLRGLWWGLTAVFLSFYLLGLPLMWQYLTSPLDVPARVAGMWPVIAAQTLATETRINLAYYATTQTGISLLTTIVQIALSFLVLRRQQPYAFNWFHWFVAFFLLFFTVLGGQDSLFLGGSVLLPTYFSLDTASYPSYDLLISFLGYGSLTTFIYLFPDGRFAPRWAVWGLILYVAFALIGSAFLIIFIFLGLVSLVHRYRRSATYQQRQQMKWIVYGLMIALFPSGLLLLGTDADPAYYLFIQPIFLLIPVTITIAVLRTNLWDVDVVIRRTVQYSIVSALLAAVYFGSITLIQGGITTVADTHSPLAIVLSTLLIAALFNPLRQRVQAFIDRRFFRQKYDAQQVLAQFAQTARDEVEMEVLQTELLRVVQETMQPETVSIWLKR